VTNVPDQYQPEPRPADSAHSEVPGVWDIVTRDLLLMPPDSERALRWLAALGAANLPGRVEHLAPDAWAIRVDAPFAGSAMAEIAEYERVNRNWPPPDPRETAWENTENPSILPGFIVFCGLLLFFLYTGPCDSSRNTICRVGAMDGAKFAQGQWWRAVTALCLHADVPHVLGNAVCCFFFGHALTRRFGYGVTWALIFLCGVAGNMTGALLGVRGPISLGASTAVFAASTASRERPPS